MLQRVEKTAKTVEEAVAEGLRELGVARDRVEVEVLEEPTRGLLGLLSRPARVRLRVKETVTDKTRSLLREILAAMELSAEIGMEDNGEFLKVDLRGEQLGVLIGRRGETLDALQYLINLAVNRGRDQMTRVIIDIENYRVRREQSLRRLAGRMADKARLKGRSVVLEPMTASERRIIHTALQGREDIYTFSEGDEPFRKIVISPRRSYAAEHR